MVMAFQLQPHINAYRAENLVWTYWGALVSSSPQLNDAVIKSICDDSAVRRCKQVNNPHRTNLTGDAMSSGSRRERWIAFVAVSVGLVVVQAMVHVKKACIDIPLGTTAGMLMRKCPDATTNRVLVGSMAIPRKSRAGEPRCKFSS